MKNPPKELQEKFPMCDAFLQVEWVDKEKRIGYSNYDVYQDGKKKGMIWALLYLDQKYPRFNYDLLKYKREGKLQEIFSFIRAGKIPEFDQSLLQIYKGDKVVTFHPTKLAIPDEATLSDNRQNVCVPYPDNERMWIAEGRQVGKIYSDLQIHEKFKKIAGSSLGVPVESFKKYNVVDLNHDGMEDYFVGGSYLYSSANKYFKKERVEIFWKDRKEFFKWSFPPRGELCMTIFGGLDYLNTDGKSFFDNNQCNLTELTKQGE